MALDLLIPRFTPVHLYRFDVESFFWVVVYFVATHNPELHTLGRIKQWTDPDLNAITRLPFCTAPSAPCIRITGVFKR